MTMRERMARAAYERAIRDPSLSGVLFDADDPLHAWENQTEVVHALWRGVVDVMLEQMMWPTIEMRESLRIPCANSDCSYGKFLGFYAAMIRAALEGK